MERGDLDRDQVLREVVLTTASWAEHNERQEKSRIEQSRTQRAVEDAVADLEDAYAALAYEQVRGDALRIELGDDPIGPRRAYSHEELAPYLHKIKALPFTGGGLTTMLDQ